MSTDPILENILTALIIITSSGGVLLYFTGRIYKDHYFGKFGFNSELLNMGFTYYVFASYVTLAVALAGVALLISLVLSVLAFSISRQPIYLVLLVSLTLIHGVLMPNNLITFSRKPIWKRLFGSKDLTFILINISFSILICFISNSLLEIRLMWQFSFQIIQENPFTIVIVGYLLAWPYLGFTAFWVGSYHADAEIRYGKMIAPKVNFQEQEWIYIVRDSSDKSFIYNTESGKFKIVLDADLFKEDTNLETT